MRAIRIIGPGAALAFGLVAAPVDAQTFDPEAPVPPGSTFTILDLQFRTEPLAGAIQRG